MKLCSTVGIYCSEVSSDKDEALLKTHLAHEGAVVSTLKDQGRQIRAVQSARNYYDGTKRGGLITVVFSGFTTTPDLKTSIITFDDGTKEVQQEKLVDSGG